MTHPVKLLIVDDDRVLRATLSMIFAARGYRVSTAEDGFSALAVMQKETPDLVLSDLNMPGMSGFELLSVVRRRFPTVRVIAMSGAYSGEGVPAGIAADAFHEKGSTLKSLLLKVDAPSSSEPLAISRNTSVQSPVWISKMESAAEGGTCGMIACARCMRPFTVHYLTSGDVHAAKCAHCGEPVQYAVVEQSTFPLASILMQRADA